MVSIIIPVYNNEKTIHRTLDSIKMQSYDDYEVIVVNDGSTDRSGEIIREFSKKDPRFIYLEQSNGGVSSARNRGIKAATHKYIMFVDGDDTLPRDALKHMHQVSVINDADTIVGILRKIDGTQTHNLKRSADLARKSRRVSKEDYDMVFSWTLCNKWLLREIIEDNAINFESYRHLEDAVFLYSYLRYASRIYTCPYAVYTYIKPLPVIGRTTTQNISPDLLKSAIDAFEKLLTITDEYGKEFRENLIARFLGATLIGDYYRRLWRFDDETADLLISYIEELYSELNNELADALRARHFDIFNSENKLKRKDELLNNPMIDIVLTDRIPQEALLTILDGLYDQFEVAFRVIADESFYNKLGEQKNLPQNIVWSRKEGIVDELRKSTSGYMIIIDYYMLLNYTSLYSMIRTLDREPDKHLVSSSFDYYDGKDIISSDMIRYSYENKEPELDALYANKLIRKSEEILSEIEKGISASGLLEKYEYSVVYKTPMIVCAGEKEFLACIDEEAKNNYKKYVLGKDKEKKSRFTARIRRKAGRLFRTFKGRLSGNDKKAYEKKVSIEHCFLDLDVQKNTILVDSACSRPEGALLHLLKELTGDRYGEAIIYYSAAGGTKKQTEEALAREGIKGVQIIDSGSAEYIKALFSSEWIFSIDILPVWWIKKPGQTYVNMFGIKRVSGLKNNGLDAALETAVAIKDLSSADYIVLKNEADIQQVLDALSANRIIMYGKLMLIHDAEVTTPKCIRKICDTVLLGDTTGVEFIDLQSDERPVFIECGAVNNEKIGNWITELNEKGLWRDDFYLSLNIGINEQNVNRITYIPDNIKIYPTIGEAGEPLAERKRLFGEIGARRFALIDPESSRMIEGFAGFTEPVQMLLTEKQMELLRKGDKEMKKAVKSFSQYGDGISTLADIDSDYLEREMGIIANTIKTANDFYETFFKD